MHRPAAPGPLLIPLTPNTALTTSLAGLNDRLKAWGYCDDRAEFITRYNADRHRAGKTGEAYRAWSHAQDSWMTEGDGILDAVEILLGEGALETLSHADAQKAWRNITSVVFKVQCIVAAVEVRLDSDSNVP